MLLKLWRAIVHQVKQVSLEPCIQEAFIIHDEQIKLLLSSYFMFELQYSQFVEEKNDFLFQHSSHCCSFIVASTASYESSKGQKTTNSVEEGCNNNQ